MDMERITLSFDTPQRLLAELRELGANLHPQRFPALRGKAWQRQLHEVLSAQLRGADGKLTLTFEIIYGHALKPAPRELAHVREHRRAKRKVDGNVHRAEIGGRNGLGARLARHHAGDLAPVRRRQRLDQPPHAPVPDEKKSRAHLSAFADASAGEELAVRQPFRLPERRAAIAAEGREGADFGQRARFFLTEAGAAD